jgi:hypothetical protein
MSTENEAPEAPAAGKLRSTQITRAPVRASA